MVKTLCEAVTCVRRHDHCHGHPYFSTLHPGPPFLMLKAVILHLRETSCAAVSSISLQKWLSGPLSRPEGVTGGCEGVSGRQSRGPLHSTALRVSSPVLCGTWLQGSHWAGDTAWAMSKSGPSQRPRRVRVWPQKKRHGEQQTLGLCARKRCCTRNKHAAHSLPDQ